MKRIALLSLCFALLALPLAAEEPVSPPDNGFSLVEEGARLMLKGLMTEMEPALDEMAAAMQDMQPALKELGPRLAELMQMMGDVQNYDAPVMLPNGDILIRRKSPLPPQFSPGATGEIEL